MLQATESLKLCIKWLRSGDLTEAELRSRLTAQSRPEEEIDSALAVVKSRQWQSDARVLERVIESSSQKLEGRAKVESRLIKRGLEGEAVEDALTSLDEDSERTKALYLLQQRLRPDDGPARAARILGAKGFEEDVIRSVLEQIFPDWHE